MTKGPMEMTDHIDGEVKSLSMGPNHSGIVTKCGKLYMLGIIHLFYCQCPLLLILYDRNQIFMNGKSFICSFHLIFIFIFRFPP